MYRVRLAPPHLFNTKRSIELKVWQYIFGFEAQVSYKSNYIITTIIVLTSNSFSLSPSDSVLRIFVTVMFILTLIQILLLFLNKVIFIHIICSLLQLLHTTSSWLIIPFQDRVCPIKKLCKSCWCSLWIGIATLYAQVSLFIGLEADESKRKLTAIKQNRFPTSTMSSKYFILPHTLSLSPNSCFSFSMTSWMPFTSSRAGIMTRLCSRYLGVKPTWKRGI